MYFYHHTFIKPNTPAQSLLIRRPQLLTGRLVSYEKKCRTIKISNINCHSVRASRPIAKQMTCTYVPFSCLLSSSRSQQKQVLRNNKYSKLNFNQPTMNMFSSCFRSCRRHPWQMYLFPPNRCIGHTHGFLRDRNVFQSTCK